MADKKDQWAESLSAEHSGWLTGFLADEDKLDRRALWRLGSWGVAAVGAVVVAILATQSQVQWRRDQFAAADMLNRQSQQIQFVAKETQTESKRLSSAIDTLNGDRDRLYARLTSVEQNVDSVTGSIKRQGHPVTAAPTTAVPSATPTVTPTPKPAVPVTAEPSPAPTPSPQAAATPAPAVPATTPIVTAASAAAELPSIPSTPVVAPVASTTPVNDTTAKPTAPVASTSSTPPVSAPLMAWKSMIAPPDTATAKLSEPTPLASATPTSATPETTASIGTPTAEPVTAPVPEVAAIPVARTEFGVDVGGANSVDGLRAIWRGISRSAALAGLRPIMMVKERSTGLGMQLRLVAGPLNDAAAAAKICAMLLEGNRPCETTTFDGQRLALKSAPEAAHPTPSAPVKPVPARKRAVSKPQERAEQASPPPPAEEPTPKPQSSLSSFLGIRAQQ